MTNALVVLLISALFINAVHTTLLVIHRSNRQSNISGHAALTSKSLKIFAGGHIINAGLFLLFAYIYFLSTVGLPALFWFSVWCAIFECAQAVVPAKDKTEHTHALLALVMWLSYITLGFLCSLLLPLTSWQQLAVWIIYVPLIICLVAAAIHPAKMYRYQMTMVLLFYSAMTIMIY